MQCDRVAYLPHGLSSGLHWRCVLLTALASSLWISFSSPGCCVVGKGHLTSTTMLRTSSRHPRSHTAVYSKDHSVDDSDVMDLVNE